jgi:diguanylate cyclase (GGDEF)-like protein/PAS domain S-box-containing protein
VKNRELEETRASLEVRIEERTHEILQQKQFFEALFVNSPLAIVTLDLQQRIVSCNPAFERLFGYSNAEVVGQKLDDLVATEDLFAEAKQLTDQTRQGESIHQVSRRRRKDGQLVFVDIFGVPVMVGDTQVGILGLYQDITERKRAEEFLHYLATHDPLTILPNRSLFYERLAHSIQRAAPGEQVAVMFLDLDGFKTVNDRYGHDQGDLLLQTVANLLKGHLRKSDTVARLGGDEFAFVFENIHNAQEVTLIAQKILSALADPIRVGDREYTITGSLGISLYPQDGANANALLKNADAAMYLAKDLGKDTFKFYAS